MNHFDLRDVRRVVLKIGSALLVDQKEGRLRENWLLGLSQDIAMLRAQGSDVVVVSSGSIALGRHILGRQDPLSLERSQAAASIGQIRLAHAYQTALAREDLQAAQVLLTLEDTKERRRYLNARATLEALLAHGAIPVVNENDTVATDEIRFGDNDRLAAQVAAMCGADLLILLSDIDGLYSGDPNVDEAARHIPLIEEVTAEIEAMAGAAGSAYSKGGMRTKLMAAKSAMRAGVDMIVCQGDLLRPISALMSEKRASFFKSTKAKTSARKDWIASLKSEGVVRIDDGAAAALRAGSSLLAAGVVSVEGVFERGAAVDVMLNDEARLAKGLVGYNASDIDKIKGLRSVGLEKALGYPGRAALIHRDDMVIWSM